jgi:hypothetical protein
MVDVIPPYDEHKDKDCRWEVKGLGIIFGEREGLKKKNKGKGGEKKR